MKMTFVHNAAFILGLIFGTITSMMTAQAVPNCAGADGTNMDQCRAIRAGPTRYCRWTGPTTRHCNWLPTIIDQQVCNPQPTLLHCSQVPFCIWHPPNHCTAYSTCFNYHSAAECAQQHTCRWYQPGQSHYNPGYGVCGLNW